MGGNKKRAKSKKSQPSEPTEKQLKGGIQGNIKAAASEENPDKRFVNLLLVYTIYKQRFRRLEIKNYKELLCHGCKGKRAAIKLCKDLMNDRKIPEEEVEFEKNTGFLSVSRLMPLIALLAERAKYKFTPSLVYRLKVSQTPQRFRDKFAHLMVVGYWFLGRVISNSLSVNEQINRGNPFGFEKGDMGFWWAGVKIMDWNVYAEKEKNPTSCYSFVITEPPKYQLFATNAITNMDNHPMYFLDDKDWDNFNQTVKKVKHEKVKPPKSDKPKQKTENATSTVSEFNESIWSSERLDEEDSLYEDNLFLLDYI